MRRSAPALLCIPLVLAGTGCVTRTIERKVFDRDYTTVSLQTEKKFTSVVEKGYEHPFVVSPARAAHILSRIDVRTDVDGESSRVPAIPLDSLYLIADGLSKAFAEADPNEQVVVMSIERRMRLGIFDRKYLTSFLAYRKDDRLVIHLGVLDWEIPPFKEEHLPAPSVDRVSGRYRVIASKAMAVVDENSVAVAWRDPIFAKPTRTRVTPGGRVVRRTILMESPEEAPEPEATPPPLPARLAPETLRKLADLEDARRRGDVDEAEYELQRRRILASDPGVVAPDKAP